MPEPKQKIDEMIEGITKSVTNFQSELDTIKKGQEDYPEVKTKIDKMSQEIADSTEKLQGMVEKAAADEKRVEELELTISKLSSSGAGGTKEIIVDDDIKSAFNEALRNAKGTYNIDRTVAEKNIRQHIDHFMKHLSGDQKEHMVKSIVLAEGSDPAGGIWCPITMSTRITQRMFERTPARQLATVINTGTQSTKFPLDDEDIETAKATETSTRSETDAAEWGSVKIDVHEGYAYPKATLQMLEDSTIDVESWLSGKVSNKFARVDGTDFISGDGTDGLKGLLAYDEAAVEVYERFKLGTMESAAANTVDADDLIDLQSHLLEEYQANASWLMNRLMWAAVVKLKDENGQYLINPQLLFSGATPQLLGVGVRLSPDLATPTFSGGEKPIVYGDFREGYTILDRLGISVIRDNITRPGFVKWNFRRRVGGGVTNFQALKVLKVQSS